jgi:hypothetical protein
VENMDSNPGHSPAPKVTNGRINGRFAPGVSGNPGGSPEATRRAFNKRFLLDLAEDWQQHGREVFKRVRRESPASYLKVCAMMVPKEMKVEQTGGIKAMTDEQLEAGIAALQDLLARRAAAANVIEGSAEPVALPAPEAQSPEATPEPTRKHKTNRLMREADTAVGPRERTPSRR